VDTLKAEVRDTMKDLLKVKQKRVEEILSLLPEEQRPLVQACFDAARHENKKNRRYTTQFIYECILMRIKAPGLYEKLRDDNKLALPSHRTLLRYMKALRPAFGFQENHFFGHIRGACGSNQHPDPRMFINVYRLLMTYSLIKPPRGSNVTGGQVMDTMLQLKDLKGEDDQIRRLELQERIDELLDSEIEIPEELELGTHEGLTASVDSYALTVFGGYVARKVRQIKPVSECTECQRMLLQEDEFLERESLLAIRTRGGLLRPSQKLFELLVK
ncbi:Transposable element P transposase, partial [Frankliniella fusca]